MIFAGDLTYPEDGLIENDCKYYWRIVIGRRDMKGPIFEIAGFMDEKDAEAYIEKLTKNTNWDDDILFVSKLMYALPPYIISDEQLIEYKIDHLKNIKPTR